MTEVEDKGHNEIPPDPQLKCLALTEKIINSLNDSDIKERYYNLKRKLLKDNAINANALYQSQQTPSDKAFSFYQSLAQENQRLKDELAEITLKKPDFTNDPENEIIASQIRELEKKILPNHTLPPSNNAVQELESLKKVISAKLDSLGFIRDKLRTENQRLKNDFREISKNLAHKIEAAKEKEDSEQREISAQERALEEEIRKAQMELEVVTDKYRTANEENSKMRQKLNEMVALQENIQKESTETEKNIDRFEKENATLFAEIEQLKVQLNIKTKELTSLQTLQRFGVEVSDDVDISEEVQKLTKQRDILKAENAHLAFELKRMDEYPSSEVITSPETISLDEDELAAQILNSKYH